MPGTHPILIQLAAEPGQTPAWAIWLFEKPVMSALVILIAAFIVFLITSQRGRIKASWIAALAGVVLAGAVFTTGKMVTTDREEMVAGARSFVSAVARSDSRDVSEILDDRLVVTVAGNLAKQIGKDEIVAIAGAVGHLKITRHITRIDEVSSRRGGNGRTKIGVYVSTESQGNATSTWTLEWTQGDDGVWRITVLDWTTIQGGEPTLGMLLGARNF